MTKLFCTFWLLGLYQWRHHIFKFESIRILTKYFLTFILLKVPWETEPRISGYKYFETKIIFLICLFFFQPEQPETAYSNSKLFLHFTLKRSSTIQAWFGTEFSGETLTMQPRPFYPVCTLECRIFLIPVKIHPLMETVLHLSSERNTRRLLDSVCLCR